MTGNITRRGKHSWRLKFEASERDPVTGQRATRFVTVRGTKKDAQRELTRQLAEIENGMAVGFPPSLSASAIHDRRCIDPAEDAIGPFTAGRPPDPETGNKGTPALARLIRAALSETADEALVAAEIIAIGL